MSDSREKVMQVAEKLVARGKLSQAIKEYRKLLRFNPNDASTLNRVGDLYARQDNVDEAVRLFGQIAQSYSKDGFFVKAIAIYKKIIRLDPTQLEVYSKLAELYHRQGLVNDARSQYQVVADYYMKHGDRQAAIEVHRKMAEVEPQNPTHRVKLAELYLEEGLVEEAMGEYQRIAEVMLDHGHVDEASKVYLRALDVDSDDLTFVSEAVIRLREDGHEEAAERVFQAAVKRNPDAARLDELMRSHEAALAEDEATTVAAVAEEETEVGPPPAEAVDVLQQVSADELEEIAASSELPELPVTEDGAYVIDLEDETVEVEVVEEDEAEIDLDLAELEAATEEASPESPKEDPLAAISALAESVGVGKGEEAPPAPTPAAGAEEVPFTKAEPIGVRLSELLAEAEVFSKYGLESKAVRRYEQALELDASYAEAHRRLVLLWIDRGDEVRVVETAQRMLDTLPEGSGGGSLWAEVLGRLSEAGFVIQEGQVAQGVAPAVPDATEPEPVETTAAEQEAAEEEAGLEWLQEAAADGASPGILFEAEEEFFDLAAELEKELVEAEEEAEPAELTSGVSAVEESLADIVEGFKKGVSEVLSPEAYDTHYNLGIAYREMGLLDEAIGEFQLSAKDPAYLVDSCSMLGASFLEKGFPDLAVKWYKRGLESPDLSEEESLSLLYDLGSVHAAAGERETAYEVFVEIYGVNSHYRDVVARIEELRGE